MHNQVPEIGNDQIQAFLKKNPVLKVKLSASIDELSATKIVKVEKPVENELNDNELAEELWILKLEERTLLNTYINLIIEIKKQPKTSNEENNKMILVTLKQQAKKAVEELTVIQTITLPLKKAIAFRKVSLNMKKMLESVEKHIKKDKFSLNKMIANQ